MSICLHSTKLYICYFSSFNSLAVPSHNATHWLGEPVCSTVWLTMFYVASFVGVAPIHNADRVMSMVLSIITWLCVCEWLVWIPQPVAEMKD